MVDDQNEEVREIRQLASALWMPMGESGIPPPPPIPLGTELTVSDHCKGESITRKAYLDGPRRL